MALGCKINERIFTFEGKDYSYDEFRALMYDGLLERIPELTAETKETLATEEGKADVEQGLSLDEARRRLMEMREEREESDKSKSLRKALIDVVGRMTEERAKKIARLIAPKLTVVYHDTPESLMAVHPQGRDVNGFYDQVKQIIHVGPRGNATHIIAHELLHPVFDTFIGADEAKTASLYDELVKDERLVGFVEFGKNYLSKKRPSDTLGIQKSKEEALIDYLGAVADGKFDKELLGDNKFMQGIKEMLYRIMEFFGVKRPVVDITDVQTLKDLAKAIATASRYSRAVAYTEPTIGEVSEEVDEMRADEAFNGIEEPKTPIGDTKIVMVDGVERTVFNSEGRPIHPTVEGVRNFWRFYKGPKDKDGKPLVVYHASKVRGITTFGPEYKTELSSMGFHFGTEEQAKFRSQQFDFKGAGDTGKYYVSIRNPLRVSHMASFAPDHLSDQMIDMGLLDSDTYEDIQSEANYNEVDIGSRLVSILDNAGYDGLVYENEREGAGDSFVPFSSTQIKSATGNYGRFDPSREGISEMRTDEGRAIPNEEYKKALDASFKVIEESSEKAWASLSRSEQATRMADAAVAAMKKSDWFKGQDIKQQRAAINELRGEIADRLGVRLAPKTEKQQQRAEEAAFKLGQKLAKQEEAERNRQLMSDFAEFMAERIAKTKEEKAALEEKWAAKFGKYKEEAMAIIKGQKAQMAQAAKNIKNAMAQANRAVATAIVGIESAREAGIDEGLAIAVKDQKMIAAAVIATINQAKMDGKLTPRQARMLTRAAAKASFDNLKSLQRFMDLVDKVTKDVEYVTRISKIRKMRKQAVANAPASEKARVREFASVNPRRMDDALLDKYQEALADLNLKVPRFAKMNAIFDDVLATKPAPKGLDPKKTAEKMIDLASQINSAKINNFTDYKNLVKLINNARTLASNAMRAGLIDSTEYDAFIDSIAGTQEKFEKKYAKEIALQVVKIVFQVKDRRMNIDISQYNGDKKELILDLQNLKEGQLSSLSLADLDMLADLVSAMVDEGSMDTMMLSSIVGRAEMAGQADRVAQQINAAKLPRDSWFNAWKDAVQKAVNNTSIAFWESKLGLGNIVAGAVQRFVIGPMQKASTESDRFITKSHEQFIKLLEKYELDKSKKERAMHKMGMIVTYLQEYALGEESGNPDYGNRDWFKDLSKYRSQITDKELAMLKELWDEMPKDQNGNVSPKAVYDAFISGNPKFLTKNEIGFLTELMDWKEQNIAPKQEFANELKGQPFKRIRFHMPRLRIGDRAKTPGQYFSLAPGAKKISIESTTGKERVDNTVGPIETSIERMFNYNVDRTAVDYYYTQAVQQINYLLGQSDAMLEEHRKRYIDAIRRTIVDALQHEFEVSKRNAFGRFLGRMMAFANVQILFRPLRVAQELISAGFIYPLRTGRPKEAYVQMAKSIKDWANSSSHVLDVMSMTGSAMMSKKEGFNRIYEYKKGGYEKKSKFERLSIQAASLPEMLLANSMWWPAFKEQFQFESGVAFDLAAFNADKEAYFRKYKQEFFAATSAADQVYEKIAGPTSQFGSRKKVLGAKTNTVLGSVLAWMTGFSARSWDQLTSSISGLMSLERQAAMSDYSKGDLASQAAAQSIGIVLETFSYSFLTGLRLAYTPVITAAIMAGGKALVGDDEEDEEAKRDIENARREADKEVAKVFSPAGIMTSSGNSAVQLVMSKYGSLGRALYGATCDIMYTAANNRQLGLTKADAKWIAELTQETAYRKPVDASSLYGKVTMGGQAFASILPPLSIAIREIDKIQKTTGPAADIAAKMLEDGEITPDEREMMALAILTYNAINTIGMAHTGVVLPFSNQFNKAIREELEKNPSGPTLQRIDGFLSNPTTFYNQ